MTHNHLMTGLIFAEYSLAWLGGQKGVVDCHNTDKCLPSAICPRSFRLSWGKAKGRIHSFGITFRASPIPLPRKMSNWKKQKMGLDSTKTYAPFYALIKNINNRKNVSFQSVSPWQLMKQSLSLSLNPSTSWPWTEFLFSTPSLQLRGNPSSQGHHLSLKGFCLKGYIFFAWILGHKFKGHLWKKITFLGSSRC